MDTIASTFQCLEALLTGAKAPKDIDIYCNDRDDRNNKHLSLLKEDVMVNYAGEMSIISAFIDRADSLAKLHLDSMYIEKELVRQRLQNQRIRAEKRLKELVFEIVGEYAKTKIRVVRRKQFLQFDQNLKHSIEVWKLRWRRFCLKLSVDLFYSCGFKKIKDFNVVHCRLLIPELNAEEMEIMTLKVNKKAGLLSDKKFSIVSAVKICYMGSSDPKSHLSSQSIQFAQSVDELSSIFNTVVQWLAKATNTSVVDRSPSSQQSPVLNSLLSTTMIDWMHVSSMDPVFWDRINSNNRVATSSVPVNTDSADYRQFLEGFTHVYSEQHTSCLFNSRVYFCLEDMFFSKYRSVAKNCTEELDKLEQLLNGLQSVYVNRNVDSTAVAEALSRCDTLRVVDLMCSNHQSEDDVSSVTAFPEVVRVKSKSGVSMHFACASVLHLLILHSARECNIEKGRAKLFTLTLKKTVQSLEDRVNSVTGGENGSGGVKISNRKYSDMCVQSLPEAAEQELISHYLKKETAGSSAAGEGPFLTAVGSNTDKAAAIASRKALSALDLLPDHARIRTGSVNSSSTDSGTSKLSCSYFLLGDDNTFSNYPGEGRYTEPQPCYYLLQVVPCAEGGKSRSASSLLSSSLTEAADDPLSVLSLNQDNFFLQELLCLYYNDNLRFPFSIQAKSDGASGGSDVTKTAPSSSRKGGSTSSNTGNNSARVSQVPSSKDSSSGWDINLLSTVCRWRSCLCDVPRNPSSSGGGSSAVNFLCKYHDELRKSLERQSKGGSSDIAKYLPRKVPNFSFASGLDESKKDSMTIRAASTLLQELWDGKLGQTVKSFTKRMTVNMSLKHFLESSVTLYKKHYPTLSSQNLQAITSVPTWTRWNNKEMFERTVMDQNACLSLLNSILTFEQLITNEIQDFLSLNIFPTAELSIIRKEIKQFRDHQEAAIAQQNGQRLNLTSSPGKGGESEESASNGQNSNSGGGNPYEFVLAALNHEKTLCDRKLFVLSSRRKEEVQARANAAAKKANKEGVSNPINNNNNTGNYNGREYKAFS